jgi:hypothetical protein
MEVFFSMNEIIHQSIMLYDFVGVSLFGGQRMLSTANGF